MEMDATGKSKGQWVFHGTFDRTVDYLSDHSRILAFNPFCHKVEPLDRDDAYRWHFRVTDPQNNPFDVIFNIQQESELLLELPEEAASIDPAELTDEMISQYTVGRRITWRHLPASETIAMPEKYLFEGKTTAELLILPLQGERTKVDFDLRIDVRFILYPAFRIIPEQIIRAMTNAGMSLIMQTATNKMFQSISSDFGTIRQL
ncbi:MAG: hypothetical protein JW764_08285 [Chlorobiaceae bacterium]|nr:hypothetical protein [Chlorobiaceae bacterium]